MLYNPQSNQLSRMDSVILFALEQGSGGLIFLTLNELISGSCID